MAQKIKLPLSGWDFEGGPLSHKPLKLDSTMDADYVVTLVRHKTSTAGEVALSSDRILCAFTTWTSVLLPPEADSEGLELLIYNKGGDNSESVIIKEDSGVTIINELAADSGQWFFCWDGKWYSMGADVTDGYAAY